MGKAFRSSSIIHSLFLLHSLPIFFSAAGAATYNYAEVLQKSIYFYECQQSGQLPSWNRVEWRGNSCLNDGSDVGHDLTGGWFDAGDHVKFNFPMAYTLTVLSWGVIEYKDAYENSGQLQHILRNIRFTAEYLLKCHTGTNELYGQVGNGNDDHSFWGPAEVVEHKMERPSYKIDASNPGSDLAAETAAAMAAAAIVLRSSDAAFADTLIAHAKQIYSFADTYRGKYSDAITDAQNFYRSWSGYNDELVWGAIWLYRATQEQSYLTKAESYYGNLSNQSQEQVKSYTWGLAWDDKAYGCYVLMAKITGNSSYAADAERWLDYWSVGYNGKKITYTPGGLAWLDTWGALRYAANTAFCALVYSDICADQTKKRRYYDFAVSQINYMLGDNPDNRSYVVGFGNNPPQRPHHRTCHGIYPGSAQDTSVSRHILYGALVGGPGNDDSYEDKRSDYTKNEVACDYNAGFTGALARLYKDSGGTVVSNFPAPETPTDEFYVEAKVNAQGSNFTEIQARLVNKSAWPAQASDSLSFRYYIDMNEVLGAGFSLNDVSVTLGGYNQGASISELMLHNEEESIYYVELDFTGTMIFPGSQEDYRKETQFRISLPTNAQADAWNPANDWSYDGLEGLSNAEKTDYIPVFMAGKHISGLIPDGITVTRHDRRPNLTKKPNKSSIIITTLDGRRVTTVPSLSGLRKGNFASGIYIYRPQGSAPGAHIQLP